MSAHKPQLKSLQVGNLLPGGTQQPWGWAEIPKTEFGEARRPKPGRRLATRNTQIAELQ